MFKVLLCLKKQNNNNRTIVWKSDQDQMMQDKEVFVISWVLLTLPWFKTIHYDNNNNECHTERKHLLFQTFKDFPSGLTGRSAHFLWNPICLLNLMFANTHSEYDTSIDLICCDSNCWYFFQNMVVAWRQYILREGGQA